MRRLVLASILLAGCSPPPAPVAVPVNPRPVVEVAPRAAELLRQVAADQKFADPWWVRLSVAWHPDPFIHVDVERRPPGPDDYAAEAGGLRVVFANELMTYLRGCRIGLTNLPQGVGFDVTFPNQDAAERDAAGRWLREQTAKHKAEAERK